MNKMKKNQRKTTPSKQFKTQIKIIEKTVMFFCIHAQRYMFDYRKINSLRFEIFYNFTGYIITDYGIV